MIQSDPSQDPGAGGIETTLRKLLREVLSAHLEELTGDQNINDLEEWDSLRHMELILGLERDFGFQLTGDEIAGIFTVDDLRAVVRAKAAVPRESAQLALVRDSIGPSAPRDVDPMTPAGNDPR